MRVGTGPATLAPMRGLLPILLALVCMSCQDTPDPRAEPPSAASMRRARQALFDSGVYREQGWTRLGDPRPGEWLDSFPEPGQTFEEYAAAGWPPCAAGQRLALLPLEPLGPAARAALEPVRAHCARFFGVEVALLEPAPLPRHTFSAARRQHDAGALLDWLAPRRPADARAFAGVCDQDMWAHDLNYVFGLGRAGDGIGVHSLVRYQGPDVPQPLFLARCMKLMTHELGHTLGLRHCIWFRCVMNGSNSLSEEDATPLEPCPVCLRKLHKACGFDVVERWRALAAGLTETGQDEQAAWVRARLEDLAREGERVPWRE